MKTKADGQYFEKNITFRSFTINAQFLIKNGGNLFVHLISYMNELMYNLVMWFD